MALVQGQRTAHPRATQWYDTYTFKVKTINYNYSRLRLAWSWYAKTWRAFKSDRTQLNLIHWHPNEKLRLQNINILPDARACSSVVAVVGVERVGAGHTSLATSLRPTCTVCKTRVHQPNRKGSQINRAASRGQSHHLMSYTGLA